MIREANSQIFYNLLMLIHGIFCFMMFVISIEEKRPPYGDARDRVLLQETADFLPYLSSKYRKADAARKFARYFKEVSPCRRGRSADVVGGAIPSIPGPLQSPILVSLNESLLRHSAICVNFFFRKLLFAVASRAAVDSNLKRKLLGVSLLRAKEKVEIT